MTDAVLLRRTPCSGYAAAAPDACNVPSKQKGRAHHDARSTGDFGELGSTATGIVHL